MKFLKKEHNYIQLDSFSKTILFTVVITTLMFANGFYLFACLTTLFILFFHLQKPYRSGAFSIILVQHFLQIFITVIQANYLNKDINYRSPQSGMAIIVSLIGIVFLFIPIIYYQNRLPKISFSIVKNNAASLSTEKCMYLYLISFFVASALGATAFSFGGLTQIILSVIKIKWLFFLLFGFLSIINNEKRKYFYLFIGLEFLLGFFSYFSDFKTVIYYCAILMATFLVSIDFKQMFIASFILVILISFALIWTSVKTDYRAFLNGGTSQQTVSVEGDDALGKLYELSSKAEVSGTSSTNAFLDRLQYTYHFAKTIERVPAIIPYQNGENIKEVLLFTTTPRYLNPDKATLDNSVKTTKYTGIHYLGAKKGVSFSLGYFAELYVDFGFWGMMIPLFIIGILYGNLYFYFINKGSPNLLFNYAIVGSFFMEFNSFEMDATFYLGRLFISIITYFLMIWFIFPAFYSFLLRRTK